MITQRNVIRPQAVNGGCCDTGCENPYDLAIIPLTTKLEDAAIHTYKVLTNTFPGRLVGMRVLNGPGEVDVVAITQPQQAAGATYIGSGNITSMGAADPNLENVVDGATWSTTECLCAVDLGCVTNTIGPTIQIKRSAAAAAVALTRPLVSAAADVFVRINFYVCYDDGTLKNPMALCGTGAVVA